MPTNQLAPKDFAEVLNALPPDIKIQLQLNPNKAFLAGGFIRDIVAGDEPNDIDIFVKGEAFAAQLCAEYAQDRKTFKTGLAWNVEAKEGEYAVQYIYALPPWGDAWDILSKFDFRMSQAALWFDDRVYDGSYDENSEGDTYRKDWNHCCIDGFYQDVEKRELKLSPRMSLLQGNLRSLVRALKFAARGWTLDKENLVAILKAYDNTKSEKEIQAALESPLYGQKQEQGGVLVSTNNPWEEWSYPSIDSVGIPSTPQAYSWGSGGTFTFPSTTFYVNDPSPNDELDAGLR
jgi:hypothetical protein